MHEHDLTKRKRGPVCGKKKEAKSLEIADAAAGTEREKVSAGSGIGAEVMNMNIQMFSARRGDRLIHEHIHDPYKTKSKMRGPAFCPVCKAVFRNGRWEWADSWPEDANKIICQACHRIRDNYPAGLISLKGSFVMQHKVDILNLIRNDEMKENAEHPLHRIMKIEEHPNSIVISTTDIHLPRRIGESLRHAHKGNLDVHYDQEGYFIRVNWIGEQEQPYTPTLQSHPRKPHATNC